MTLFHHCITSCFQSNSNFGKTIQNVRDYMEVKLHTGAKSALKAASLHNFKSFSILDENLVQTNHFPHTITHTTPLAIGVTILELVKQKFFSSFNVLRSLSAREVMEKVQIETLFRQTFADMSAQFLILFLFLFQSKFIMFDAWYNKITTHSQLKFQLGMTDTDSFLFKVSDGKMFREHCKSFMDYSNYPSSHPHYSHLHKAALGYFKDELLGIYKCTEFVGLRSKCYALNLVNISTKETNEKKVCKGLGRVAIKNNLNFAKYKKCLFDEMVIRETFHSIRSVKHHVTTVAITKKALSFFDTKRWVFSCGIHSVPYGSIVIHYFHSTCPFCCCNNIAFNIN